MSKKTNRQPKICPVCKGQGKFSYRDLLMGFECWDKCPKCKGRGIKCG